MQIKLRILSLTIAILASFFSYGQTTYEEVVYLKNGSIIRGVIIEQVPNQTIKIETKDGNLFVFNITEIEKITKEQLELKVEEKEEDESQFKSSGFANVTEINYSMGISNFEVYGKSYENTTNSYGIKTIIGYQFSPHVTLGLGISADIYDKRTIFPISFDARFPILKNRFSPVFNSSVGYAFGEASGLLINPSFGIKVNISRSVAYLLNFGIKIFSQEFTYISGQPYPGFSGPVQYSTERSFVKFITINTGFSF